MRSWVLRASQREASVEELLAGHFTQQRPLSWPVRQHTDEIREGDRVFFWYEDGTNAIVARGTVVSPIRMKTPDMMEASMFLDILPGPRIQIRIDELRLTDSGGRLALSTLLADPNICLLPFLHRDGWFEWALKDREARDLEAIWEARDPSRKSSLY